MNQEIGSEFHRVSMESGFGIKFPRKGSLTFCGRTAIESVLDKIPNVKTALLPSYCCDSMIEPFRRAGIDVDFFDVNYDSNLKIDLQGRRADILLWCNYFGFKNEMPDFEGIIIEDITHSLFSDEACHSRSDYLIASVRKWEPICSGGYCSVDADLSLPPQDFIDGKMEAMELKMKYLCDLDEKKKPIFLSSFNESNKWLSVNYSNLSIDSYSREYISKIDMATQKEIRRRNAHVLYEGLGDKVEFMFKQDQMDCPLFVPILLRENRDEVRSCLASNKVYCPVHWPHPNAECSSNLYDVELSLICDQRYDENDMERIVSILKNKL